MPIIVPVLASGLGWWLIWLAFDSSETWPYLAAYIVSAPLLFFFWGWAEEKLGFRAARRLEDEVSASTVRHAAELGMQVEEAELRAEVGEGRDDQRPLPRVNAPDFGPKAPAINAPERHGRAIADIMR